MRFVPLSFVALALFVTGIVVAPAAAQAAALTEAQIKSVVELVASFGADTSIVKNVEASLRGQSASTTSEEGKELLKLKAFLKTGANGDDVRILQKILASDPVVYPEGLVTGFFGPLTETAVKRFQAKLKIEQVGVVGSSTLAKINEILWAAGITGDIPTDLLGSRVKIKIEIKNGKQEIKIEVKCDSSGSSTTCKDDDEEDEDEDKDELEIEVEIKDGKARVDVEQNGDESRLILNVTDRSAIIKELSTRLSLTESEIESVIEFEDDDKNDSDDDDSDEDDDDEEEDEDDD